MKYRTIGNTDMKVSVLSFGASALGSVFRSTDDAESVRVVRRALASGVNYVDTAPWYGHGKSETLLGQALKGIPRDQYFIATKVGRYRPEIDQMFDFSAERTIRSVDESLTRLGLDYVDVIQVHDMEYAPSLDIIINETLPALQKVKDSGKARYIGITGYPLDNFRTILERSPVKIDSILTYCRYSMNDTGLAQHLPYFKSRGVGVVNASVLSQGLLSQRGPPAWHTAPQDIRDACSQAAQYCKEREVDISRLALHYSLTCNDIDTTLVSTASEENLQRNLQAVEEGITDHEAQVLEEVMDRYMRPLDNKHWEGKEVAEYWTELQSPGSGKVPG